MTDWPPFFKDLPFGTPPSTSFNHFLTWLTSIPSPAQSVSSTPQAGRYFVSWNGPRCRRSEVPGPVDVYLAFDHVAVYTGAIGREGASTTTQTPKALLAPMELPGHRGVTGK